LVVPQARQDGKQNVPALQASHEHHSPNGGGHDSVGYLLETPSLHGFHALRINIKADL
jgi:hypothetical protein